jgi:hypothetical protein
MQNSNASLQMFTWPNDHDPVAESLHNGKHCLFYNPEFLHSKITYKQKLHDLGNWANSIINNHGIDNFLTNKDNHYDIANLVKLNMWIHNIQTNGIVKPMLIWYLGDEKYIATNGESRLRALECIPEITTVTAFISTTNKYAEKFKHLTPVTTFDQFAKLCKAVDGQKFLFRLADDHAPYGLDWYEYDSRQTTSVTPGEEYCVGAVTAYLNQHPGTVFTVDWFAQLVDWNQYKNF